MTKLALPNRSILSASTVSGRVSSLPVFVFDAVPLADGWSVGAAEVLVGSGRVFGADWVTGDGAVWPCDTAGASKTSSAAASVFAFTDARPRRPRGRGPPW